jgi:hypothetical protein
MKQLVYYDPDDGPLTDDQLNQIRKLNMNDKIKLLLEQSGFQYITDDGIGWAGNYNASLPKFAELIVFECIKIAVFKGDVTTAKAIKEHFGVK